MSLLEQKRPMTIEAFLAFADAQPDDLKWELIDGEPVMNPAPSRNHQKIVLNLLFELESLARRDAGWEVLPGIGAKLSDVSMPVPDVLIRPIRPAGHYCDDVVVAFEVLSPSSKAMDLRWKRNAYPRLPSLQHYVVLAQDEVRVRCYGRMDGLAERQMTNADRLLELQAISARLKIAALYANTGL